MRPTALLLPLVFVYARTASAADDDPAAAAATALFESGVAKMEAGRCEDTPVGDAKLCAEAREAFREAYARYPAGLGALRNLAFVEKGLGLVASASQHFHELAEKAPLDPKPARRLWADFAKSEIALLAPRVPHLTIAMPKPAPASTRLTVDDAAVPPTQYSVAIAVDPGAHSVRVDAAGHAPFARSVTLAEGETVAIDVTLTPTEGGSSSSPSSGKETFQISPRLPPMMLIGAGAATFVVGLGFGVAAIDKRSDACTGNICDRTEYERGHSWARTSTILTISGGLAAASGVVWYLITVDAFRRPAAPATATGLLVPYASPDGAGVGWFRTF